VTDCRRVCQVCGCPDTDEYQIVKEDSKNLFSVLDEMTLCGECGSAMTDNIQTMLPELVRGKSECMTIKKKD